MPRTYDQFCPLARSLDLVGERWTLLIVRELLIGPRRYSDLQAALPGIGTNLLAGRLRRLEQLELVERRRLPAPAASTVYELTERGQGLEPAVVALAGWGLSLMDRPHPGDAFDPAWVLLSFKATFDAEAARGVRETYEFRIGERRFHAAVDDGELHLADGPAAEPELVIEAAPEDFIALGTGAVTPEVALGSGRVRIAGDPEALHRSIAILGFRQARPG